MSESENLISSLNYQSRLDEANVEEQLPNIVGQYVRTSDPTIDYNCLAWAVELTDTWIDPTGRCVGYSWPKGIERDWSVPAYKKVLAYYGYVDECPDGSFEDGFVKIAMYVDEDGRPSHFARQVQGGNWTSKLGELIDVVHSSLSCVAGNEPHYGQVSHFFKRKGDKVKWP